MWFKVVVVTIAPLWSFSFSTSSRTDKSATRDGLENIPDTVTGDILVLMLVLELLWLLKSVFTFTLAFDSRISCGTCGTCHCVQRLVLTSHTLVPALIAMRCLWLRPKTQDPRPNYLDPGVKSVELESSGSRENGDHTDRRRQPVLGSGYGF